VIGNSHKAVTLCLVLCHHDADRCNNVESAECLLRYFEVDHPSNKGESISSPFSYEWTDCPQPHQTAV
jgi:hypothetical protein